VRRGELLMVFVNTCWSGRGGEGHVETTWLRDVLAQQCDARWKLVIGHHPVHPVNGFSGPYQREIGPDDAADFWRSLVDPGVLAYLCGHILAFDVQVHDGVLQICTGGAGTAHRMPEGVEYLHCVQGALDGGGLRYQVLDTAGAVRERLEWPVLMPSAAAWRVLPAGESAAPLEGRVGHGRFLMLRLGGRAGEDAGEAQTLLCAVSPGSLAPLWIGLRGVRQKLTAIVGGRPGRSPHYWFGPEFEPAEGIALELLLYPDMGPGGILCRRSGSERWSSLSAASATGLEQFEWPERWSVGHAQGGSADRPFRGADLSISVAIG
jgi:hypothetical protein